MTIDLDALEKRLLAVESSHSGGGPLDAGSVTTNWHRNPDGPEAAAAIKALVAELREARGLLRRWRSDLPTEALEDITDAFLARNGKGEG